MYGLHGLHAPRTGGVTGQEGLVLLSRLVLHMVLPLARRYFRYTGMVLPLEYNTMASESLEGDLTVGGCRPA